MATLDERVAALEAQVAALQSEVPEGAFKKLRRQVRKLRKLAFEGLERVAERGNFDPSVASELLRLWDGGERPSATEMEGLGIRPREKNT